MSDFGAIAPAALGAATQPSAIRLGTPASITTESTSGVYPTPWGVKEAIPLPSMNSVIFVHGNEAMRYAIGAATYRLGLLAPPTGFTATPSAVRATITQTFTAATRPNNNDEFSLSSTLGAVTFTFKDTLSTSPTGFGRTVEIKRGADLAACIANVAAFLNETGTSGTEFFVSTSSYTGEAMIEAMDTTVSSTTATTIVYRVVTFGASGNLHAATEITDGGASWSFGSTPGTAVYFSGGTMGTGTAPSTGTFGYAQATVRRADGALSAITIPPLEVLQESQGQVALAGFATFVSRDATDYRRWYRTLAGGRRYHRGDDVTATSDTDTIDDETLADETNRYEYDESIFRPRAAGYPTVFRYGAVWRGRLWGGGAHKDADYSDGTVALTEASASATLSTNGRVKEDVIGHWLRVASHPLDYQIIDCDPSTRVLTLHRTYAGSTDGTASYTIVDLRDPFCLYYSEPVVTIPGQSFLAGVNNFAPTSSVPGIHSLDPSGVTGLAVIQDSLVVFTKTGLWRVVGNTGNFRLQHIAEGCGAFCGQAIQRVGNDDGLLFWLGPGGVFAWGGGDALPTPLSKPTSDDPEGIQNTIAQINADEADIVCSNYNPTTNRIRWWVPLDQNTSNRHCIRYDLHTKSFATFNANDVTAACTMPGPTGSLVTVVGCLDGTIWQLDLGYSDGAWGFEPTATVSSWTAATRSLAITGTTLPTSGDGLAGVPVLIYRPSTGAYEMRRVVSNTSGAMVLDRQPDTTPTSSYAVVVGGIPLDVRAQKFDFDQPYLMKWTEAMTLSHEVETVATEVWAGACSDNDDPSIHPAGDYSSMTESDGQHNFWLRTPRGKTQSWRILSFVRGFRVRIRSLVLSMRSPMLDEVER